MKILIVAHFAERLEGQNDGRFEYLSDMLVKRGHDVTLLTSDFDHFTKKHRGAIPNKYLYKIHLVHEIGYKKNVSLRRLYSHWLWGCKVANYFETISVPDVVYLAVPSLTVGIKTAEYCKKNKVRFLVDVQDLWPEAFCLAIKNKVLQKLFLPFEWMANRIYKAADFLIAVSETYLERALKASKYEKGISVFLGNDGERFDNARKEITPNGNSNVLWLAYIGTLGASYDIRCVINAMKLFKNRYGDENLLRFKVIGDGPQKQDFEKYANECKIDCVFTGGLPYDDMVREMCSCDIVVNPIMKGGAQSITNKVGDYALAGLPVVSTQENQEYRQLIETYHCGINCECGNAQSVAEALIKLAKDSALRKKMGAASRRLGEEKFDRRYTYLKIIDVIESKM